MPVNGDIGPDIMHKDKLVHVAIYVIFTIVWFAYFNKSSEKFTYVKAIAIAFCAGVLVEVLQEMLTVSRSADVYDVLANCFGIILAIIMY